MKWNPHEMKMDLNCQQTETERVVTCTVIISRRKRNRCGETSANVYIHFKNRRRRVTNDTGVL